MAEPLFRRLRRGARTASEHLTDTVRATALALAQSIRRGTLHEDVESIAAGHQAAVATVTNTAVADATRAAGLVEVAQAGSPTYCLQARPDCCPTCSVTAGLAFPITSPPLQHPNCRCTVVTTDVPAGTYDSEYAHGRSASVAKMPKSWQGDVPDDLTGMLTVYTTSGGRTIRALTKP